jgi:hypothetical protein
VTEGSGDYKKSGNYLIQPKPGKKLLNNAIDMGKTEMQKKRKLLK